MAKFLQNRYLSDLDTEDVLMLAGPILLSSSLAFAYNQIAEMINESEGPIQPEAYTEVVNYGAKINEEKLSDIDLMFSELLVTDANASIGELLRYGAMLPDFKSSVQRFGTLLDNKTLIGANDNTLRQMNNEALLSLLKLDITRDTDENLVTSFDAINTTSIVNELTGRHIDVFDYVKSQGFDKTTLDQFAYANSGIQDSDLLDIETGLKDTLTGQEQTLGHVMINGCICQSTNNNADVLYFKDDTSKASLYKRAMTSIDTAVLQAESTYSLSQLPIEPDNRDVELAKRYLTKIYDAQGFNTDENEATAKHVVESYLNDNAQNIASL